MRRLVLSLALLTLSVLAAAGEQCGAVDAPCTIANGEYNLILPDGWSGGPAVIHLHGYNGSGAKVIGNTGFARRFTARSYALIAPSALPFGRCAGCATYRRQLYQQNRHQAVVP